jgi:DNA-directed RNA polymerase specialized sigma24 family protein
MNNTGPEDSLIEIWADPQIRRLARRMAAGNAETADDALQRTYIAIVRHPRLHAIRNLRAYFITVLRREVTHVQGRPCEIPVDDVDERHSSPSFESRACSSLDARARCERFMAQRDRLLSDVAARSDDPRRYRAVIGDAAEQILRASVSGEPSEADSPSALRAVYPEYFAAPGAAANTCDQRAHRARTDVRKLLMAVISRDELSGD